MSLPSGDFEHAFDFDRSIRGQRSDTDGGAGMAALVAEGCDHQVGRAVEHLGSVEEIRRGIDKAAKPHHADHLVEIAERGLDLRQQIDRATARRRVALLDGDAGAQLALGDQLAFRVEADLARDEQQVSGADKADIIGNGSGGLVASEGGAAAGAASARKSRIKMPKITAFRP